MEWFELGEAIVAALDEGATQREVAKELGHSQAWVNRLARWYLEQHGESRWYLVGSRTTD
jgi:hypothetical protein